MTDKESEEIKEYFNLMQKSMDCFKSGDIAGFKEYSNKANAIYNSSIEGMSADEAKGTEKIEPGDGETVTKTTVTKSKNGPAGGISSPEEAELLSSVTGKGGLKGETTDKEDELLSSITGEGGLKGETTEEEEEMLDNAESILKGVMGKWL